ncbi:MogA/MoaB family molybdenum cofactor biosynthesis protein [Paenibacillus sp. y28]|uniref:MogA/MoaB family molybdenum cofactor biosynthesis protein n=1 Tax=Paenibacillus sp. y28 TaxID=3129110 RepID=UPI003016D058
MRWKVGLVCASDSGSRGEREDTSAQVIRELVEEELFGELVDYQVVPDETQDIMAAMIEMMDYYQADLIFTTGGIGMMPRDVTPEATLKVIERQTPGFPEAMRYAMMRKSGAGMLNRATAGIRGKTLIINLPGTPEGVHECLSAILDQLPRALRALTGRGGDHLL